MSNTKRARWDTDEVTAANCEELIGEVWTQVEGGAVRKFCALLMEQRLHAAGHSAERIAEAVAQLDFGDDEDWLRWGYAVGLLPSGGIA
jgi:hypothetical protein